MQGRVLWSFALGWLAVSVWACGGSADGEPNSPQVPASGGTGAQAGTPSAGAGAPVITAGTAAGGATGGSGAAGGSTSVSGAAGTGTAGGGAGAGASGSAGTGGSGEDPSNPGNYPQPPRLMMITRTEKVSIGFAPSAANSQASGSQHFGEFDPKKKLQSKLVIPLGGVNSDPWKMGWAVDRGYHVLTVDSWNDYPKDPGYPEYLESWSGEDLSQSVSQNPANSVMARVKAGLTYLQTNDPSSDWGYFLDQAGEVRWNDVIVFGYSFGGQMGVAASKYIAADRIVITSSPNVPIDSPWLKQPAKTPPARCYFLGGVKDGEHKTHLDETALLGWPGEPIDVTNLAPPYASNRLEVNDGHSSFCGRPFNDGMVDWDRICEFMFHTQK